MPILVFWRPFSPLRLSLLLMADAPFQRWLWAESSCVTVMLLLLFLVHCYCNSYSLWAASSCNNRSSAADLFQRRLQKRITSSLCPGQAAGAQWEDGCADIGDVKSWPGRFSTLGGVAHLRDVKSWPTAQFPNAMHPWSAGTDTGSKHLWLRKSFVTHHVQWADVLDKHCLCMILAAF